MALLCILQNVRFPEDRWAPCAARHANGRDAFFGCCPCSKLGLPQTCRQPHETWGVGVLRPISRVLWTLFPGLRRHVKSRAVRPSGVSGLHIQHTNSNENS